MSAAVSELPSPPQLRPAATPATAPGAVDKMNPEAEGATPLMYACQQARDTELKTIMAKKPGAVRERDRTQKSALHYCAENPTVSCAEAVLGAAPDLLDSRDKDGYTTLHLATIAGNSPLIRLLLTRGADVNCLDNERHSVVHWATVCGEVEALETVLAAGAQASSPDMHGGYPLHYAAQMCGPAGELTSTRLGLAVLRTLLSHGVEVNVTDQDGRQPILWAASAGSADAILALVNAGANVEADDKDGLTALHCAASRGHTDCLETLVSLCGAAVDVMDSNGCTPLFYAVTLGHADATQLLLEHGAQPNRQDRKGRTPAHCGAAKGQLETLRILASRGANMWARNVKGDYPLHEAVASGRKDLVRWLLSQRPDAVNASNNDGRCPLHIAAINNNVELSKILLDHESLVNPVMRTAKGGLMTPLDAALYKGNRGCAKYLQLHGGVPANKLTSQSAALRGILQRGEPHSDQMATPDWGPHLAVPDLRQAQSLVHSPIDLKHLSVVDGTRTLEVRVEDELLRRGSESSADDKIKRRRRKRRPKIVSDGSEEETDSSDRHRRRRRRRRKNVEDSSGEDSDLDIRRQKQKSKKDKDSLESESEGTPKRKKKDLKHHRRKSVSTDRGKEEGKTEGAEEKYYDKIFEETKITENGSVSDEKNNDMPKESRRILKEEIKTKEVTKSKKIIEHKEKEKSFSNPTITKTSKTTREETKTEEQIMTKTSQIISSTSEGKGDEASTQESQDTPVQQVVTAIVHQEESAEQEGINSQSDIQDPTKENTEPQADVSDSKPIPDTEVEKSLLGTPETNERETEEAQDKKEDENAAEVKVSDDTNFWEDADITSAEGVDKETKSQASNEKDTSELALIDSKDGNSDKESQKALEEKCNDENKSEKEHLATEIANNENKGGGGDEQSSVKEDEGEITKEDELLEGHSEDVLGHENKDDQLHENVVHLEETEKEQLNVLENDHPEENGSREDAVHCVDEISNDHEEISNDQKESQSNLEEDANISHDVQCDKDSDVNKEEETNNSDEPDIHEGQDIQTDDRISEKGLIKVLGRSEVDDEQLTGVVKVEKINSDVLKDRGRERERTRERRRPSSFEIVSPARSLLDEDMDSETPRSRSRTGADSSQLQDSGFEPSPRRDSKKETSRIPRACRRSSSHHRLGADSDDDRPPLSTISVTQAVQHSMRKYHLERRIFHELLELKRLQIRAGRSNEAVLVKRLVDDYRRAGLCIGLRPYEGVYTFRSFEKYLYDQLRLLQSSDRRIIPRLKSTDDLEKLTKALRRARAGNTLLDNVPQDPLVCTHGTHRCFHATHAYTGVPCAAYIAKINHHTMPKPGAPATSFLPRIDSGKQRVEGQGAEIARCLRYVDPSRPVTLELSHGAERQVISLPTEKLDKNKRYYVTFTIKGGDVSSSGGNKDKHRHAKSF